MPEGTSFFPLEVKNLVKEFKNTLAVNNVSFHIKEGEIFGLLGPNGAGKTTIISSIVTTETPTSGEIRVFGYDVFKEPREAKIRLGLVPQELVNHGFFNIEEILKFHSGYYGRLNNKERIDYLIHRLGLWEHRKKKVKQLSGGMKRRLLIAKALVHEPKLILLDEPTAGVDIELRSSLWDFVVELKKHEKVSILLTTHYLEEAEELCDRVGILQRGSLIRIGPTSELIQALTQRHVSLHLSQPAKKLEHPFLRFQSDHKMEFQIPYETNLGNLLGELKIDLNNIFDIRIQEGNLEDAFVEVLKRGVDQDV